MQRHDDRRYADDPERRMRPDRDERGERFPGAPDDRENVSGGRRYEQARRQPGYAREGAFDSRSARGGRGGPGPDPHVSEESYGSGRYGQLPGAAAPGRGESQRAPQFGGPRGDDEGWLQDQGYPKLGRGIESRTAQVEHGPYAGGTQQGGPRFGARGGPGSAAGGRGSGSGGWGTGPHVGRGPRGYRRSDARILEDVAEQLTEHDEIDASDIEVDVRDGVVYLQGTVDDRRTRRLAEEVAEGVRGVLDVVNRLQVAQGSGRDERRGRDQWEPRRGADERDPWARQGDPGPSALGHTYQGTGMGTGGMDVSYRGAATDSAARTGGPISTDAGGAASTGGMPTGPAIGSDQGMLGTTAGRGTGTYEAGRSGDLAAASMSDRGSAPMGASTASGGSVGGGASSTGGPTGTAADGPGEER